MLDLIERSKEEEGERGHPCADAAGDPGHQAAFRETNFPTVVSSDSNVLPAGYEELRNYRERESRPRLWSSDESYDGEGRWGIFSRGGL